MNILQAMILGLVQGLAEFLPISSSGHLVLVQALMGITGQGKSAAAYIILDILLHVGTLIAVLVVFWKDWMAILRNPFKSKTLLMLIIASIPAIVIALPFNKFVESFFSERSWFLGIAFLITGAFLLLTEKLSHRGGKHIQRSEEPGVKHAVAMGCMQAVALLPGVSRSGSTLLGGVASGMERQSAAKFSFMMSAPAILGSLIFEGKDALESGAFQQLDLIPTVVGMLVAAISGYLAIRFFLRLIGHASLKWFALYVALVGIAVIVLTLTVPGFLRPQDVANAVPTT